MCKRKTACKSKSGPANMRVLCITRMYDSSAGIIQFRYDGRRQNSRPLSPVHPSSRLWCFQLVSLTLTHSLKMMQASIVLISFFHS